MVSCGLQMSFYRVDLAFCSLSLNEEVALAMTLPKHYSSDTLKLGKET